MIKDYFLHTKPLPDKNRHFPRMKIQYFHDTDTLYIEFKNAEVAETRDLDEDTLLDLDQAGNIRGITVEHARARADIPRFSYEHVTTLSK